MSHDRQRFDVDEARRNVAAMRQLLVDFNMAMDKLEREIRAVPSWWQGDSLIPFMRLAEEILADRHKIADLIKFYGDAMELALNEKLAIERESMSMFDADLDWMHTAPQLRVASLDDMQVSRADDAIIQQFEAELHRLFTQLLLSTDPMMAEFIRQSIIDAFMRLPSHIMLRKSFPPLSPIVIPGLDGTRKYELSIEARLLTDSPAAREQLRVALDEHISDVISVSVPFAGTSSSLIVGSSGNVSISTTMGTLGINIVKLATGVLSVSFTPRPIAVDDLLYVATSLKYTFIPNPRPPISTVPAESPSHVPEPETVPTPRPAPEPPVGRPVPMPRPAPEPPAGRPVPTPRPIPEPPWEENGWNAPTLPRLPELSVSEWVACGLIAICIIGAFFTKGGTLVFIPSLAKGFA